MSTASAAAATAKTSTPKRTGPVGWMIPPRRDWSVEEIADAFEASLPFGGVRYSHPVAPRFERFYRLTFNERAGRRKALIELAKEYKENDWAPRGFGCVYNQDANHKHGFFLRYDEV